MNSALLTEVSGRTPRMLLVGVGSWASAGKPKCVGINSGKQIPSASRNHLTRAAKAQTSKPERSSTFIANGSAVAAAIDRVIGHGLFCLTSKMSHGHSGRD